MKWIMVMGAVLALSPVAFGAASFSLTESGGSATAVNAQAGTTISLDFSMTAASTVKTVSLGLLSSGTGIFEVSARDWDSALGTPDDDPAFEDPGALDSPTADVGGLRDATPLPFPAGPSVLSTFDLDIDSGATLNQTYTITMVGPGSAGSIYVNYEDGTSGDSGGGYDYGTNVTLGSYEVTIVPEPASMLLLAGALPFLRRRRSA